MNKEELFRAIQEVKGIKEEGKAAKAVNVREAKEQAKAARANKLEAIEAGASRQQINMLRKRPAA
jgi:hypothetical protein